MHQSPQLGPFTRGTVYHKLRQINSAGYSLELTSKPGTEAKLSWTYGHATNEVVYWALNM